MREVLINKIKINDLLQLMNEMDEKGKQVTITSTKGKIILQIN